ncbi:MAG: PQQ-binding-like beta-propeller repeat protein, partial [Bacteroidota bacterium]
MKFKALFTLSLLFVLTQAWSQITPLAEVAVEGKGRAIFIHDYTGIPIIQTDAAYMGVNPVSYEKLWEIERSGGAATAESLGGDAATDYTDIYDTPFAFVNGSVVNVLTGQIVVDGEADEIKRFNTYYIVPEAELILLELGAKGMIRLYGIDPFTSTQKWGVDLREQSGLGQMMDQSNESTSYVIPPLLTAAGHLLYHNDKSLASVDLKSGKLLWNEKIDPGYIYLNDDATKLLVAERRGGLAGAMAVSGGQAPRKFGKKLYLLDATNGESLWSKGDTKMDGNIQFIMPYGTNYMVVHDEGLNIYDYSTGKEAVGQWKKNYREKGIKDIVPQSDGLMVYFKNKRMLIDPANGEELWKKPEKLEREPPAYVMGNRGSDQQAGDASYYFQGNNLYLTVGKITNAYRCDAYTHDEANNRLIITRIDNPDATYIGAIGYDAISVDLGTGKPTYGSFSIRKNLHGVDPVEGGYFFYNDRGYNLMSFDGNKWSSVESEYYPDPSRGERFIKGFVANVALAGAQVQNVVTSDPAAMDAYNARNEALNSGDDLAAQLYERRQVGRVMQDFAFFFSRNDDNDLVLFKVD